METLFVSLIQKQQMNCFSRNERIFLELCILEIVPKVLEKMIVDYLPDINFYYNLEWFGKHTDGKIFLENKKWFYELYYYFHDRDTDTSLYKHRLPLNGIINQNKINIESKKIEEINKNDVLVNYTKETVLTRLYDNNILLHSYPYFLNVIYKNDYLNIQIEINHINDILEHFAF